MKAGKKVFRKCKACHQVGEGAKHRTGPMLNGVFGRSAGAADGFKKYSDAMTAAGADGLVWDDATMSEFLAKPKKYVDGTSMAFAGLKKEADIAAVIAYLRSESGE
ncbi:MAG: cytochrome c family protein [Pseudomonadota bacterium]